MAALLQRVQPAQRADPGVCDRSRRVRCERGRLGEMVHGLQARGSAHAGLAHHARHAKAHAVPACAPPRPRHVYALALHLRERGPRVHLPAAVRHGCHLPGVVCLDANLLRTFPGRRSDRLGRGPRQVVQHHARARHVRQHLDGPGSGEAGRGDAREDVRQGRVGHAPEPPPHAVVAAVARAQARGLLDERAPGLPLLHQRRAAGLCVHEEHPRVAAPVVHQGRERGARRYQVEPDPRVVQLQPGARRRVHQANRV
mmetsp:Transcript_4421/g.9352  ORF Transcript_4421/g.9352 Transcript_4421/m.9352 type:complete len:256 (+) Transcript_4421:10514-11281(+)